MVMNSNSNYKYLSTQPIKLLDNRVWRTYSGGQCLEEWKGKPFPQDGDMPEQWVASTVQAKNVGREHIVEGLSEILLEGSRASLKEIIESDPASFLGQKHSKVYGGNPALLVKLLDAGERLTIQVHPDREFALRYFNSPFGKTESWYVIGGRTVNGEQPYVLFGFKPFVTKEIWQHIFELQDIQAMMDCLHKIPVKEGDVFLVEGGIPHAIGSGCFLIEVQEPTDLTLRVERTTPSGNTMQDMACHQGIGFKSMLDCFHYEGYSYEETLAKWKKEPQAIHEIEGNRELQVIDAQDTDRFSIHRLDVSSEVNFHKSDRFCIAIIVSGIGKMIWDDRETEICESEEWFLPAGRNDIKWVNTASIDDTLQILLCYAPN